MATKHSVLAIVTLSALVAACSGEDGAKGEPGAPGQNAPGATGADAQARFVVPNKGVLDREIDVVVSGAATKFDANTAVDFGAGITVVSKNLISPTSMSVKIKIDKGAALGPRDVTVAGLVAAKAFDVRPAINVKTVGAAEQGGLGIVELENLDERAFDAGQGAFRVNAPGLVYFGGGVSGPFAAQGLFLVPPLATPAKLQVAGENLNADGTPRLAFWSAPEVFSFGARAPGAIAFGTPKNNEAFGGVAGSKLYKFATPANANAILTFKMHVEKDASLTTVLWNGTAKSQADIIGVLEATEDSLFGPVPKEPPYDHFITIPVVSGAARDHYLSVIDLSGAPNAKFNLLPTSVTATVVDEAAGAHDSQATAQAVTIAAAGQGTLLRGEIVDDTKFDWYKFTVAEGEVVEISLDTAVEGQAGVNDGTDFVAVTSGGPGLFGTTASTEALTAGEHFLAVAAGKGKYTLTVRRVAPPATP